MWAKLKRSELARRIIEVASGNFAAQLITILFAPLITRIYSPEAFGAQGVFLAAIGLLAPAIALRYPMAIVLADDPYEIRKTQRLSLLATTVTSIAILLIIFVFRPQVSHLFGLEEIGPLIFLLPVALFLTGCQEIASNRAYRENRFRAISVVSAFHALLLNGARVLGGLISPVGAMLMAISSVGPGVYAAMLRRRDTQKNFERKSSEIPVSELVALARRRKDFPLFRTPTDLLHAASQAVPVILLSFSFGPSIAGFYTLTQSALTMPAGLIGTAIGSVLFSHFAELSRNRLPLFPLALKSGFALLLGPGLLVLIVASFGPDLFAVFFGEEWREAGTFARWLSILTAVSFAQVPCVRLAPVIGRQDVLLVANILTLIASAGSIFIAARIFGSPLSAVIAFSLTSAVFNVALTVSLLYFAKRYDSR